MSSLHNISVLALDVDGVLTDGTIIFAPPTGAENKHFHVHDGLGISIWINAGHEIILVSGRKAECVSLRAEELGIQYVLQDSKDKIEDLDKVLSKIGVTPEQTAFVGDDLGDIAVMQHVGYAIAVNNAAAEVKEVAHWVTPRDGGHGAVRDAIEHIMKESGNWQDAIALMNIANAQQ